MKREFRKPLIIMTPKSLLRMESCVSSAEDFTSGHFREILPGPLPKDVKKVRRVIFCTGKVYYDLLNSRETNRIGSVAIVRLEQLYPLNVEALHEAIAPFGHAERFVWCQEESRNMGAWSYIEPRLREICGKEIAYAGRNASASPAVGAKAVHMKEQNELVEQAFTI
jgi:2-oxoglutarate dehydrogenase E1 component